MLGQEMMTLRNDNNFADFAIKTGDKVAKCHWIVIAAVSPVLKAMLQTEMKEASEKEVRQDNITPQALDILIEYIYTGKTRIKKELLIDVVEGSDFLQLDELTQMCTERAPSAIQPHNVISWSKLSDKMNKKELPLQQDGTIATKCPTSTTHASCISLSMCLCRLFYI